MKAVLPPIPDPPGLSRFGAHCPDSRRVPHRDIELSRFAKFNSKIFYLQIEFAFCPKDLRLSNTQYSSNNYIESVLSKMNICSELCEKIN
jgi:hypothetical protein